MRKLIRSYPRAFCSLLIIVLAAIMFFGFRNYPKDEQLQTEKRITIEVVNDNALHYTNTYEVTTKSITLGEIIDELGIVQYSGSTINRYITSLDGMEADETRKEWWGFYINDEFAQTGVDSTNIKDGDKYTFVFNVGYQ